LIVMALAVSRPLASPVRMCEQNFSDEGARGRALPQEWRGRSRPTGRCADRTASARRRRIPLPLARERGDRRAAAVAPSRPNSAMRVTPMSERAQHGRSMLASICAIASNSGPA
jgi:hypothetical protein